MNPTRILVVDDHAIVRRGVRALLESHPGWKVCEEASNGMEAVRKAKWLKPDVVVMDITMPEMSGLEATRQIKTVSPSTSVLILTIHESEEIVREVLNAGARGYVFKSDLDSNLLSAVEALVRGKAFFSTGLSEIVLGRLETKTRRAKSTASTAARKRALTARQREIVYMVAGGKTNKEVATVLGISTKTAETHRLRIMRKLGLQSVQDLVRYAIRHRIINP